MSGKRALITGITGQDGAYLARHLLELGYTVFGASRRSSGDSTGRLKELGIADDIRALKVEMCEYSNIRRALIECEPDEVYNFAAQSFVAESFAQPLYTSDVNGLGATRLLESVREVAPHIRVYQASTSEMFGNSGARGGLDESSPFRPMSPYAVSKLYSHQMIGLYREAYGMHCSSGILFNHESPLRGVEFITRKISDGVVAIQRGHRDRIMLGNLNAERDWGAAPEYVVAMHAMLQKDTPGDYVVATGISHSVRDFANFAFQAVGVQLEWYGEGVDEVGVDSANGAIRIAVDPKYFRPADIERLRGNPARARAELGWQPKMTVPELAAWMVETDMRRAEVGTI